MKDCVPRPYFAALAGMSDEAVEKKTGRKWKQWVGVLDRSSAHEWSHPEIARHLRDEHGVSGWWAQTVTVGYERIRGLREKGQQRGGTFEVNKSKTYPVSLAELWTAFGRGKRWIGDERPKTSKGTRLKSRRMRWTDGTPVDVYFWEKGAGKSQVQLQHRGLATRSEANAMRAFWTEKLAALGRLLSGDS